MKFYNSHNKNGFSIDGKMDSFEKNFNLDFSPWEMASSEFSGTFLRTLNIEHDFEKWFGPEAFMRSWYYDNSNPNLEKGSFGASKFPNGWSMCSSTLNNQVLLIYLIKICMRKRYLHGTCITTPKNIER